MRHRNIGTCAIALLAALLVAGIASAAGTSPTATWKADVVASGLDSPRGLVFAPDGTLLVAEAGHGGDVCRTLPEVGDVCVGTSAQIAKVDPTSGTQTPLVRGLYSESMGMEGITGVDGLAAHGGQLYGVMSGFPQAFDGWSCDGQPGDCANVLATARGQAGQLITFTTAGAVTTTAGIGAYDLAWSAAHPGFSHEPPNANPYGVVVVDGGPFVADAGANTLDYVTKDGDIRVVSALAPPAPGGFPADTVPTCVTVLRGNLLAGSLSGHLFRRGGSFTPTEVPVADTGGTTAIHHVTGCTSDNATGDIYLVDMWGTPGPPIPAGPQSAAGTGSVVQLAPDGTATVIASGLDFPNGIALAPDGSLYVSVGSTCTAAGTPFPYCAKGGQIVRLSQP